MWFRNQLIPLTLVIFLIVSHSSGDRGQWSKPLVGDGKESAGCCDRKEFSQLLIQLLVYI